MQTHAKKKKKKHYIQRSEEADTVGFFFWCINPTDEKKKKTHTMLNKGDFNTVVLQHCSLSVVNGRLYFSLLVV